MVDIYISLFLVYIYVLFGSWIYHLAMDQNRIHGSKPHQCASVDIGIAGDHAGSPKKSIPALG